MQVIDTALVNIVGRPAARRRSARGVPTTVARRESDAGRVSTTTSAKDHLVEKQPVFVQQGLIYGVTAAKNSWLYRESDLTTRVRYQFLGIGPLEVTQDEGSVLT
jgi:hypothetical protein